MSHVSLLTHEAPGKTRKPMMADSTAPKEKKTESNVKRYCLSSGRFSVPRPCKSAGLTWVRCYLTYLRTAFHLWASIPRLIEGPMVGFSPSEQNMRNIPAVPSQNIQKHNSEKRSDTKLAISPNTAVRKSVALKGKVRPSISDKAPHVKAPIIIPACNASE